MKRVVLLILVWLALFQPCAHAVPWGANLWPNGSFEQGLSGWHIDRSASDGPKATIEQAPGCAGESCLRITAAEGQTAIATSPALKLAPGWHVLSFWYRYELRGEKLPLQLTYVDRMMGPEQTVRRDSIYFYMPEKAVDRRWSPAFLVFRLRDSDTGITLRFTVDPCAAAMSIDALSVRRLAEVPTTGEVTAIETQAYGTDRLADPASPTGWAERVEEGKHKRGSKTGGGARFNCSPGLYRVTYRFRQESRSGGTALGLSVNGDAGCTLDDVRGNDFASDEQYQSFSVPWIYPFGTGSFPGWDWAGKGIYRYASVTMEKLLPLNARESWDLLAEGVDPKKLFSTNDATSTGPRAWIAQGLYSDLTRVPEAIRDTGLPALTSNLTTGSGGELRLRPAMPDLSGAQIVALLNVPAKAIGPMDQLALRSFVERGGTLIVTGGFYAFGHGGYQGSFLEETLPVSIARPFDLTRVTSPLTTKPQDDSGSLGRCEWVHNVTAKPGATVIAVAGTHPALTTWKLGRGSVIAVTATVLGDPENPFWTTPLWRDRMRQLLISTQPSK